MTKVNKVSPNLPTARVTVIMKYFHEKLLVEIVFYLMKPTFCAPAKSIKAWTYKT